MAAREQSTKEKLLGLLDDIELVTKELLDGTIASKQDKNASGGTGSSGSNASSFPQSELIQLLMNKNSELKEVYQLATEQSLIEERRAGLETEVERKDAEILALQKSLKESETLLSTALYQARQKLDQISKSRPVSSEELIRFAHRISSTNAVAAPQNWLPGDPRRPYPTDLEMRMGLLGRLSDLPSNAQPSALLEAMHNNPAGTGGAGNYYISHAPNLDMASGSYVHPPHFSTSVGIDPSTRNHEEVDIMSSDSSSTSSSDSQ